LLDDNGAILSYTLSDNKGHFSLKGEKSAFIVFELLGYEKQKIDIKTIIDSNNIKVSLKENPQTLPEIVVKVSPIEKHSDTVVYNAVSFTGQEDRYLVDLLKKLPGIKVNDNGSISYQGDAISKFYIEGRDLLGGQYTLATNNLPVDAVAQIEVLENHQHAKVLKGIEYTDKAALNVKLKQNRLLRPFGEVAAGLGGVPTLYNGKTFMTQIASNLQTLLNLKANNFGIDIINETENKISTDNIHLLDILPENLIQLGSVKNLPISLNRYLFNRSYSGSINNLISVSKDTELKINVSYTGNSEKQELIINEVLMTGNSELKIGESTNLRNKSGNFLGAIAMEHNSSGKFIKNELETNIKHGVNNHYLNIGDTNKEVTDENRPSLFRNTFQALIKYDDYKTFKINSLLRYLNRDEALKINNENISEQSSITESFGEKFWLFKNMISTTLPLFGHNLETGVKLNYKTNAIERKFVDAAIFYKSEEYHGAMSFIYQIKSKDRITTTVNLPLNFYRHIVNTENHNKFIATPSVSNNIPINYLWTVRTRLGYDWNYGDFLFNTASQFLRNHRTTYIPSNIVPIRAGYFIGTIIKFSNLSELLFFDINIMYRSLQYNYLPKISHTANMSFYTTESRNNSGKTIMINANMAKTVPMQLVLTITPNFTQTESMMIQQDNLIKNKANVATLALKAELKKIRNIYISYQALGRTSWQNNNLTDKRIRNDLEQRGALFWFPRKNIDLSATAEYTLLEMDKKHYTACTFVDFKGRLKLKRIEFELMINNILNNRTYSRLYFSSVNSMFQNVPLRGREFILSMSLKF
jgi:hypothetical protein